MSSKFNYYKPRMYRKNARKDYLDLAKCKKRTAKKIRKAIKKQLQYVKRDLGYVATFLEQDDVFLKPKQAERLAVIRELVDQQQYMYDNKVHSVKDRIVSISQPYIRPIVRGKAKSPVEFGAKRDMSIDEKGLARLEKQSYTDNTDRIEVERGFSLAKRCYGLGLLHTKLDITTRSSIALSVIAMNVNRLTGIILRCVMISLFSRYIWRKKSV